MRSWVLGFRDNPHVFVMLAMRPSSAAVTYSAVKDQLVSLSLEIEVGRAYSSSSSGGRSSSSSIGLSLRHSFRVDGVCVD